MSRSPGESGKLVRDARAGNLRRDELFMAMSAQQRELYSGLAEKSSELAGMYLGAVLSFRQHNNPERFIQSAHSLREMMNGFPKYYDVQTKALNETLGDKVSAFHVKWERLLKKRKSSGNEVWKGKIDRSLSTFLSLIAEFFMWFAEHRPNRKKEIAATLREIDASGGTLPSSLEFRNVEVWGILRDFFIRICHHDRKTNEEEFEQNLGELERFLLNRICPRTFEDFSEIDRIIAEVENDTET